MSWRLDGETGQSLTMTTTDDHDGVTASPSVTVLQPRPTLAGTKLRVLIAPEDKGNAAALFGLRRRGYLCSRPRTELTFTHSASEATSSS